MESFVQSQSQIVLNAKNTSMHVRLFFSNNAFYVTNSTNSNFYLAQIELHSTRW